MENNIRKDAELPMIESSEIAVYLGSFERDKFKWKILKKFSNFDDAYTYYKDFILKQIKLSDEELIKIWGSGRLDIEIRQGKKLLNWCGIYSRKKIK